MVASNGTQLGFGDCPGSRVVVHLNRQLGFNEIVLARRTLAERVPRRRCSRCQPNRCAALPPGGLLTPDLTGEVRECMRVLHFTNTQVGATLFLERVTGTLAWEISDSELYARVDLPLVGDETLIFWQEARNGHCQVQPSERGKRNVDKTTAGALDQ